VASLPPQAAAALRFAQYALVRLWLIAPALSLQFGLGRWLRQRANGAALLVAIAYFAVLLALVLRGNRPALAGLAMLLPLGAAGLASIPWIGAAPPRSIACVHCAAMPDTTPDLCW